MRPEEVTVAGSVMVEEYEEVEVAENRGPQYVSGLRSCGSGLQGCKRTAKAA